MKTLRAQVTALLVLSMLVVVAFANFASFFLVGLPPREGRSDEEAGRLVFLAQLAKASAITGNNPLATLSATLPPGQLDPGPSHDLTEAMARLGAPYAVTVLEKDRGFGRVAAIRLEDGRYLAMSLGMPPPPPHDRFLALASWIALISLGTILAVVLAVRRLMRPLALIEQAVAEVGPDGELPRLEVKGPAEVRAAAATINRLSDRLRGAMESRMRIVAAAAHDFRTPLTRMRLRAEFIADDEERAQWFSDLAELDRIADSAIRLVREEVEGVSDEDVRLDDLARTVVKELTEMGRSAVLVAAEPVTARGQPLALRRAVRNLAMNAATHGGGARLTVRAEGDKAVLLVEDDGPGIPEALMGQVFEPFFRVDPARQATIPGAGLGLAIANEIIARHGGRLRLANRPEGGLSQRAELPGRAADEDA